MQTDLVNGLIIMKVLIAKLETYMVGTLMIGFSDLRKTLLKKYHIQMAGNKARV